MAGSVFIKDTELRVSETAGTAVETIERSGSLAGDVTIHYAITGDTATGGQDFVGGSGTITMPDGVSEVTVPIQILDDSIAEPTEKFVFSLVTVDNATLFAPRTSDIYILDDENPAPPPPAEPPLVSDFDVTPVPLVTGLNQPIRMVESPIDPSVVYVAEKPGEIVTANLETGAVTPFIDLSDGVNDFGDRGMLSIALHPDFVHNPYVYATIVVDPPETAGLTGNAGPDGGGNRYAELVRFTADASTNYTTVVPGSEVVLLGDTGQSLGDINGGGTEDFTDPQFANETSSERYLNPDATTQPVVINGIKQDYWKVDSTSHVGGSLAFGPDGALYVGTGDGASFDTADPRAVDIQSLDSLNGKILRIDPMTGLGLPDNPFVTGGMSLDTNAAKVFQLGLRNPFSIDFTPDGRLIMTDTGWNSWEELNSGGPGANFGWPYYEGADGGTLAEPPGYRDFASAPAFYSAVANGDITVTAPFRAFSHDSADPGFQIQAITGSEVVYTGGVYPPGLTNDYIFTDFVQGEIYTVNVNDRTDAQFLYQWPGSAPTDFIQGADGFVYYADLVNGVIGRLNITAGGPATTTIGSGADTLVLKISEDAYQGDAQFTVSVDGVQIGGTLTAHALHASGQNDTINVLGDFATGNHTLTVNFLNDAYGGTPDTDRNLYVDGVIYDGTAVPNGTAALLSAGPQDFAFTDTGTPSGAGTTTTIGSGADTLVLKISEDAYQGDAQFTVSVDGVQIGGTLTATALHSSGADDTVNVLGNFATGNHTLTVDFLNDAYAGTPDTDRNLYVDGITYDGTAVAGGTAALLSGGPQDFTFTDSGTSPPPGGGTTTTIGSGADTLVLKISEDAFQGDAQYTVSVDGVQIGGTLTATASHTAGADDTVNVLGNFAPGNHTFDVAFLNDAYGGTPDTDRNLYIDGATYDGTTVPGVSAELQRAGTAGFTFTDTGTTPPPGPDTLVLHLSEDAFNGDAQFTVLVDGTQIGGPTSVTTLHSSGTFQDFTFNGDFGTGPHTVEVDFLNDAWGGSAATDRNLYVGGITFDGTSYAGQTAENTAFNGGPDSDPNAAEMYVNGTVTFTNVGGTSPPPPPPAASTIVLHVSEDAFNGDAQFLVFVDGVQQGGTQTATASHSAGQVQDITMTGNYGAQGPGTVDIKFINDAWGGSASTDRNLYVQGIDVNGVHFGGNTATDNAANGHESDDPTAAVMDVNGIAEFAINHTAPPPDMMM